MESFKDFLKQRLRCDGIYLLRGSFDNVIQYAEIKNANKGISLGYSTDTGLVTFLELQPTLTLENTKIFDIQYYGIESLNSRIKATNVLIYNVGQANAALTLGGDYGAVLSD